MKFFQNFKLKNFFLFVLFFFINIGSKEVFSILREVEFIFIGTIILSLFLGIFFIKHSAKYTNIYVICSIFYILLLVFSFKSLDFEYGFQKAFLGLLVPLLLFRLICSKKWNEEELLKYFILTILVINCIGILYKIKVGLFNRSDSFGLLGSITFGWISGMGLLAMSLKRNKKLIDFLLIAFFFLMVLWTGSKGPLFAFFIIAFFFVNRILGKKIAGKIIVIFFLIISFFFVKTYSEDIRSVRAAMSFFEDPEGYTSGAGKGSIGLREYYLDYSLEIYQRNPFFGVGFGGWNDSSFIDHRYPHNIYLELLSETGPIGILIFILLLYNLRYRSIFGYTGIYVMICLSFSGDFSYFRYALFMLLISTYLVKEHKTLK